MVDRARALRDENCNTSTRVTPDGNRKEREDNRRVPEDEDDEPCGAKCFIRRIRESRMPVGFKLTSVASRSEGSSYPIYQPQKH